MNCKISASIVGALMHPIFLPIYAIIVIMFGSSVYDYIPVVFKLYMVIVVLSSTIALPIISLPLFKIFGLISSYKLDNKGDGMLAMLLMSLGYILCMYKLSDMVFFNVGRSFFLGAVVLIISATVINYFDKICLHTAALSALCALIINMTIRVNEELFVLMILSILLVGLVSSSRLLLGKNNPIQVVIGFVLGFSVMFFFTYFDL